MFVVLHKMFDTHPCPVKPRKASINVTFSGCPKGVFGTFINVSGCNAVGADRTIGLFQTAPPGVLKVCACLEVLSVFLLDVATSPSQVLLLFFFSPL